MKVLSAENRIEIWLTCKECKTKHEIDSIDFKKEQDGPFYYVCPCCKSTQYGLLPEIPAQVEDKLNTNN